MAWWCRFPTEEVRPEVTDTAQPAGGAGAPPVTRTPDDWASPRGFRTDTLPWQLWERAKRLVWDPADLDLAADRATFAQLSEQTRFGVAGLVRGFMIGEEGVTLDVAPLLMVMADEGRVEEVMYLTTFAFEEAKHVDFFRRWVEAAAIDFDEIDAAVARSYRNHGLEPPSQSEDGIFERVLPQVMRRLLTDHSTEAVLDASVTYNQFVEGGLAVAGYRVWDRLFQNLQAQGIPALSGLQRGLSLVRRDESRHITYGTYLCRRLLAARPDLVGWATARLRQLHADYVAALETQSGYGAGDGSGEDQGPVSDGLFSQFLEVQVERRIQILERPPSRMTLEEV